jgi:hypothetical protein
LSADTGLANKIRGKGCTWVFATSAGGGKIGTHAKITRRIKERSFIAFTSRGSLLTGLKERGTRSRVRRLICCVDFLEKRT